MIECPDVVVYHGGCNDGLCAAAIAYELWDDTPMYLPSQYQQPLPQPVAAGGKRLLILDFCYPEEAMKHINDHWEHWLLIDHHIDHAWVKKVYPDNVVFDVEYSAAMLTWKNLRHRRQDTPELIRYVQDRDLWRWELPYSRRVAAAMQEWKAWTPSQWCDALYTQDVDALIKQGKTILEIHEGIAKSAAKRSQRFILGDTPVRMVNCTTLISETCHEILNLFTDVDIAAAFFFTEDGVHISLRSRTNVPCNQLAQALAPGGGGHPNAAGVQLSRQQFIDILEGR